jgi:Flp pilus assembly protein TadG
MSATPRHSLLARLHDRLRKFSGDRSGNIAILFIFMAVPFCASVGLAVDMGRVYHVAMHTQSALDAAALAAGRTAQIEKVNMLTKASASASAFFNQAKPTDVVITKIQFSPNAASTEFTVTATSWVRTPFLGTLAIISSHNAPSDAPAQCKNYYACVKLVSTATAQICLNCSDTGFGNADEGTNLEIALVLDMSGSMAGSKTTDLIAAAKDLVDIVVWDDQNRYYSKVALAPYSIGVDAGKYADKVRGAVTPPAAITAATKANPIVLTTAAAHGFKNGDSIYIHNVLGMTQLNSLQFTVASATTTTFALSGINGKNYTTYKSGGSAYCTTAGCEFYAFKNSSSQAKLYEISTCVSERTGVNAYTDAAPSTTLLGRNYPVSTNPCPTNTIVPLTKDRTVLKGQIDALKASGSTGGHIGIAWGWYLLSPNFGYVWPGSEPANYGAAKTKKIAVIMTDGEYNSTYCNGVISQDSISGSGSVADHINCNAANGLSFDQSKTMCAAMKAKGANIEVYTVGFLVIDDQRARDLMSSCATDASHFYVATNGDALKAAFRDIALKISKLRLTH